MTDPLVQRLHEILGTDRLAALLAGSGLDITYDEEVEIRGAINAAMIHPGLDQLTRDGRCYALAALQIIMAMRACRKH